MVYNPGCSGQWEGVNKPHLRNYTICRGEILFCVLFYNLCLYFLSARIYSKVRPFRPARPFLYWSLHLPEVVGYVEDRPQSVSIWST